MMEEATNEIRVQTEICEPVDSLEQLWSVVENPPKWTQRIVDLFPRGATVVQNFQNDCHVGKKDFVPKQRLDRNSTPKTLVCHDMMNGYLEDKYANPVKVGNKYTFYRWSQIDIFIYFSHRFITIPPLCWINVAHQNGVKVLGTFITEWTKGEEIFKEIFESHTAINTVVKSMVDLCILFKLAGWFINVENKIEDPTKLKYFVKTLTDEVHKRTPNGLVIWYDSVVETGLLAWQNELNNTNRCFFDVCDGIFINYTWSEANMANTATAAEHRALDVYVGIDVFGRNTYGGGKFDSYKAAEQIRKFGFSMAIFAQGWTYETLPKEPEHNYLERFLNRDNAFWRCLWPFLYTHPITNLFNTSFYIGTDKEWYKLIHQETQLSKFPHPKDLHEEFEGHNMLKNECRCLQLHSVDKYTAYYITKNTLPPSDSESVHHLFSCDIPVQGKTVLYYHTKKTNENQAVPLLELILLFQNYSGSVTKIVCSVKKAEEKTPDSNTTLVEVCPTQQMQDLILHEGIPEDWQMTCFEIDFSGGKLIEIGANLLDSESIYLCGFGIIRQERLKDI